MSEDALDYEELRRRNVAKNMQKLRELELFGASMSALSQKTPKTRKRKKAVGAVPSRASGRARKPSRREIDAEESEQLQSAIRKDNKRKGGSKRRSPCEDCHLKDPSFGMPAERRRRWCHSCSAHHPGAVSLKNRADRPMGRRAVGRAASAVAGVGRRQRPPCEDCHLKDPSFGLPDQKKRRWCHQCAQQHEGAVSLKKRRTPCEDCKLKDPSFGMPAERKRRWCHQCSKQHNGAVCLKLRADTAETTRVRQEHSEGGSGKAGPNSDGLYSGVRRISTTDWPASSDDPAPAVNTVEEELRKVVGTMCAAVEKSSLMPFARLHAAFRYGMRK